MSDYYGYHIGETIVYFVVYTCVGFAALGLTLLAISGGL